MDFNMVFVVGIYLVGICSIGQALLRVILSHLIEVRGYNGVSGEDNSRLLDTNSRVDRRVVKHLFTDMTHLMLSVVLCRTN